MQVLNETREKLHAKLKEYKVFSLGEIIAFDSEALVIVDDYNKLILKSNGASSIDELVCPVCKSGLTEEIVSKWEDILSYRTDAYGKPWCKSCTDIHDSIDWDAVN